MLKFGAWDAWTKPVKWNADTCSILVADVFATHVTRRTFRYS